MFLSCLNALYDHFIVYWEHYGNDVGGSKFSSLRDIDKTNVARLKQEWVYRWAKNPWGSEHRLLFRHQGTPLMVDDGSESGAILFINLNNPETSESCQ